MPRSQQTIKLPKCWTQRSLFLSIDLVPEKVEANFGSVQAWLAVAHVKMCSQPTCRIVDKVSIAAPAFQITDAIASCNVYVHSECVYVYIYIYILFFCFIYLHTRPYLNTFLTYALYFYNFRRKNIGMYRHAYTYTYMYTGIYMFACMPTTLPANLFVYIYVLRLLAMHMS